MTDWIDRPISEISQALREHNITAEEIAETIIARHKVWDKKLNAYKTWDENKIREQAASADVILKSNHKVPPLIAIPISVKDIFGVKGYPTFAGSPDQLPEEWEKEGPLINSVREDLCIISGKTHTVEFAFGGLGINPHWVTPHNPWDSKNHRVPGGSSAGAGVSLHEGSAKIAFGTDTGGSVRIPASLTGNVGLKTTKGRWSTDGIVPLSTTFDTPGILTRTVEDAVFAFEAIDLKTRKSGKKIIEREISGISLGITKDFFWDKCQNDIGAIAESCIAEIIDAGVSVKSISLPEANEAVEVMSGGIIAASESFEFLKSELPGWDDKLHHYISSRMETGRLSLAKDYLSAIRRIKKLWLRADTKMSGIDVLAVPTVPITPPIVSTIDDASSYANANLSSLSNTMAANSLNLCGITIPIGLDNSNMPVGLQLLARSNHEENLLSVALSIETKIGTAAKRIGLPPLGGSI